MSFFIAPTIPSFPSFGPTKNSNIMEEADLIVVGAGRLRVCLFPIHPRVDWDIYFCFLFRL